MTNDRVGLVLTGAAARGAYQAGVLSRLLPALAQQGLRPTVAIGTSAGAINAALWASYAHLRPDEISARLRGLWVGTDSDDIFRNPLLTLPSMAWDALRSSVGLGGGVESILDTSRLVATAEEALDTVQISANVDHGVVDAIGVVATRMPAQSPPAVVSSGRSVLFLDTTLDAEAVADPDRALDVSATRISAAHVIASSAIPLAFPAVRVEHPSSVSGWYADGGIRLNGPLQPAIALDVDRLVVVSAHSTRYGAAPGPEPDGAPTPDVADGAAHVLHAFLADRMVEDLAELRWTNRLCAEAGDVPLHDRCGAPLRAVPVLEVGPQPGQLARVAEEVLREKYGAWPWKWWDDSSTWLLGRLLRSVGDGPGRYELLSYLAFESEYFAEQISLGEAAADAALDAGWSE